MYKKITLSIIASIFALGLTIFNAPVQALDCAENCEEMTIDGYAWAGEDTGADATDDDDTAVTTSDDVVVEEIEIEDEEIEEEPEMWPVYLSFGAIGVTLFLIIVINLASRKYNRK